MFSHLRAGTTRAAGSRPLQLMATLAICAALALGDRANAAGGAYVVDDVEIDAPGSCKVENWAQFANNGDRVFATEPACVFNLGRPVEIALQFSRARSAGSWSSGLTLQGKTNLVPVEKNRFGVGLVGGVSYDLTAHETASAYLFVPFTFQPTEPLKLNFNLGGNFDIVNDRAFFFWGAGFEYSLAKQLTLIGEVFGGQLTHRAGGQVGLRYTPHEKIDLDLIYGRNLTGEQADWVTAGLNLRF